MNLNCGNKFRICRRTGTYAFCMLTPILLSPLAVSQDKASRCAFVTLWMAVFWMLEPVHLAVTALMPVVLLPLLGILSGEEVCKCYMNDVLMMFWGGLAVAVAVEHSRLHERIALKVLMILGSSTKRLMLGFMLTTMFLSMWISNTATTAMMVPIVDAIMAELSRGTQDDRSESRTQINTLHKTLLISIAYSANCGGTGTVTGTSPNMIFKGQLEELHPNSTEITFASWMMYNVPGMVLCVIMGWILLQLLYAPCWRRQEPEAEEKVRHVIRSRYQLLGKITFHEIAVSLLFVILVFLWVFREPKFMPGWASAFSSEGQIGNSVPVVGILFVLLLIPSKPWSCSTKSRLLEWQVVQSKLPWGLVLLLGGGFALAKGIKVSGLSEWLGLQMSAMSSIPPEAVLVILCILTAGLTEIVSNSAVSTILLPVVSRMAIAFEVHPLYLMLPVTICSSYAFMLPVATGPNAIVFDCGRMATLDMVKPGIVMNLVACAIQICMINTLGVAMFNLNEFPFWANQTQMNSFRSNATIDGNGSLSLL